MVPPWRTLLSFPLLALSAFSSLALASLPPDSATFENTAVVRTVDLGGATTHITTTYQLKSLQKDSDTYYFALSEEDADRTTHMEVKAKLKGVEGSALKVETYGFTPRNHVWLYSVVLPKPLAVDETATLFVNTIQSHATKPLPATIKQSEPQQLVYSSGVYVLTPYSTALQRIKFRSPSEKIISYSTPASLKKFSDESNSSGVSKSGSAVTYGPYRNIPPSSNLNFLEKTQEIVDIHYMYDVPVLTVSKLERAIEVSHWGSNVNVQDDVWLKNDGARLKGHFSRIEHAKQGMMANYAKPHIINNLILHLPSGVRDPYYYDTIGNVSTSRFRPAPQRRAALTGKANPLERSSILELKPRYPLLGGWNYSFTMGYDMPLQEWAAYQDDKVIFGIPFLTPIPHAAFDDVEVKITLPEGADVLEIIPPFPVDAMERGTHITYLDTIGRPTITFKKSGATDKHSGMIYIVYRVSLRSHFQKPLTVTAVTMGLFVVMLVLRRVDFSIKTSSVGPNASRKKVA